VVWFSDLHYYQRLVISFAGCLLQDSFFFFFLGIRKMDYGGASKQEEGEHACYTLILLQESLFSLIIMAFAAALANFAGIIPLPALANASFLWLPPFCVLG
jgi:hypothetical protein